MPAELVFVLVHGAWGGAHGFRKVRGPLRAAGREVFTPSLTGIGERAHLTSPQVRLTTHRGTRPDAPRTDLSCAIGDCQQSTRCWCSCY